MWGYGGGLVDYGVAMEGTPHIGMHWLFIHSFRGPVVG